MSLVVSRQRRRDINVVPLIDVMVVLVFFLLLSSRFEQARTLSITPPSAVSGATGSSAAAVVIGVDKEGRFYLEGRELSREALAKALLSHAQAKPADEVLIVADERSLTGAAVHALDAVAKAGLRPRLLTRQPR